MHRLRSNPRLKSLFCALGATLALASACKHGLKKPPQSQSSEQTVPPKVSEYRLHKLVPYTIRVRRPSVPGANPKAGPGGIDYRTDPLPDEHFDCNAVAWLFGGLKLAEIRACLEQVPASHVFYSFKRLPLPELDLEISGDTPACLKTVLPVIPVPREIFFQSTEGERLACYSARFKVEANEIGGFKLPFNKAALKLDFPLTAPPKNDEETRWMLMTWVMSSFFEPSSGVLVSHLVPDVICAKCLGEKTMIKPTDPEPMLWPTD